MGQLATPGLMDKPPSPVFGSHQLVPNGSCPFWLDGGRSPWPLGTPIHNGKNRASGLKEEPPMTTQFLHTALVVRDLQRSQHFYGTLLGLTAVPRPFHYGGVWYQLGPNQLHLIEAAPDHPTVAAPMDRRKWGRNNHVALGVTAWDAMRSTLEAAGYGCVASASGRRAFFVTDPDGHVIEITEISPP